jgi:hypothetical protein
LSLKTKVDGLSVVCPQNKKDGFLRFSLKTAGDGFLRFILKTDGHGFLRFSLKTGGGFLDGASKPRWWRVSWFGPQNRQLQFGDLGLKITTTVAWFVPQNQTDYGLLVAPQNRRREVSVGHASRFTGLLHVEESQARVFQSYLKTGGGTAVGGVRGTIIEVVSESS